MTVEVFAPGYDSAAAALIDANHATALAYVDLTFALANSSHMAGDDVTSRDFAVTYDAHAQELVDVIRELVDAAGNLGVLIAQSVENHRRADRAAIFGAPPLIYEGCGVPPGTGEVDVERYGVPTSEGGDESMPALLAVVIDQVQGMAWPSANTERLRWAARAWRRTGGSLDMVGNSCGAALEALASQRSPEIRLAIAAVRELRASVADVGDACRSAASACEEYADEVERRREEIEDILRVLLIEAGITAFVGGVLTVATGGLAGSAAATAVGARAAAYGGRFLAVLGKLRTAVRVGPLARLERARESVRGLGPILRRLSNRSRSSTGVASTRVPRSLDDLPSLRGALPDDVRRLIPSDWTALPLKRGQGTRYLNPHKRGESIMIEAGTPGARDPLHGGPYVKISRNGSVVRIPLKGNPVLRP